MRTTIAKLHLFARVGDSPVMNEIATIDVEGQGRDIGPDDNAPPDASAVITLDLAGALRAAADEIELNGAGLPTG